MHAHQIFAGPWLRGRVFDLVLIVGVLTFALVLGGVASLTPALFAGVLLLDFWLLAYPHVASTFTRVACDRARIRRHWFLLFALPPLVFGGTAAVTLGAGVVALNTVYFTWQTWHYTRQSYGIARAYRRRAHGGQSHPDRLSDLLIYVFPLWGYIHRAVEEQDRFYGMPLHLPDVAPIVEYGLATVALTALAVWSWRRVFRPFRNHIGETLFVLSHILISTVSYLWMRDITEGWLFINIWHNAQYLLFVWAANVRRYEHTPNTGWMAQLSQPSRAPLYALFCLGAGAAFYSGLGAILGRSAWDVLPLVLVGHMTVNFHHYLIDAVIWRGPKRLVSANLRSRKDL